MRPSSSSVQHTAIRKRAQIAGENKTMFICVAIVSVIVGFALVASVFLFRMILFNEKVLQAKEQTVSNLQYDNDNISSLENKIRVLDTNEALISAKANSTDDTLQVVLDALPSKANSLALGASIQNKLLSGISNLSLDSLQVNQVDGVETSDDSLNSSNVDTAISDSNVITFTFSVTGDSTAIQQALTNLEKSIRTIDINSIKIETQTSGQETMTVQAQAFYEPEKTLELTNEVITQ